MNALRESELSKHFAIELALLAPLREMLPERHHLAGRQGVVMNVTGLKMPLKRAGFNGSSFDGLMSGSSSTPFAVHGLTSGKSAQLLVFNPTDPQVRASMETMHRNGLMPLVLRGNESGFMAGATSGQVFSMALADTARHQPAEHKEWLAHVRQLGPFILLIYGTQYASLKRCDDVRLHIVVPMDEAHLMHALLRAESVQALH